MYACFEAVLLLEAELSYKLLCASIVLLVGWSLCWSVGSLVGRSVIIPLVGSVAYPSVGWLVVRSVRWFAGL